MKPNGLLQVYRYNPVHFPKSTSSLVNLNRCITPNVNNYSKCILSKVVITKFSKRNKSKCTFIQNTLLSYSFQLPVQSTVSVTQTRAASTQGDHVRLWLIERIVSASFLSLVPAALLFESKFIDILLAAAIVVHTHW